MKARICLCPETIAWITRHLVKSNHVRKVWRKVLRTGSITRAKDVMKFRKRIKIKTRLKTGRTAKQRAATRRLIAFNKRRRR